MREILPHIAYGDTAVEYVRADLIKSGDELMEINMNLSFALSAAETELSDFKIRVIPDLKLQDAQILEYLQMTFKAWINEIDPEEYPYTEDKLRAAIQLLTERLKN